MPLPYSIDLEKGLLSSMIQDPDIRTQCLCRCSADLFFIPAHRLLFETLEEMTIAATMVDFIALKDALTKTGRIREFGASPAEQAQTLSDIWNFVPTAANWQFYLSNLWDLYRARETINFCGRLSNQLADPKSNDWKTAVDGIEKFLTGFVMKQASPVKPFRELIHETFDELCLPVNPGDYLYTGLPKLDRALGGIERGNLCVIGADTSGGKTALAQQIVLNALRAKHVCAIFTLEMTEKQLIRRLFACDSQISMTEIKLHSFDPGSVRRLNDSFARLADVPLSIHRPFTINEIINQCRRIKMKADLRLVVVDYLQLVQSSDPQKTREREIAGISAALQQLAGELDVAVIALSQLNDDGRLRESRTIGHDAQIVLLIEEPDNPATSFDREIHVKKNRDGARNVQVLTRFYAELMTFVEV